MNRVLDAQRVARWSTWAACGLAAVGAVVAIVVPLGGTNRVSGVAPALAIGAAALAVISLSWGRGPALLAGLLYAVAVLAVFSGIVRALSLPLLLLVEGVCPSTSGSCPPGFERPMTSGENLAVYATTVISAAALLLVLVAVEARYLHRARP